MKEIPILPDSRPEERTMFQHCAVPHAYLKERFASRIFKLLLLAVCFLVSTPRKSIGEPVPKTTDGKSETAEARAQRIYITAQARFEIKPEDTERAWQFARSAFDWAEFAKDNKQREEVALQGIAAARRAIVSKTNSAPAHYYLAMNMGQLARTRTIGALKLVDEMEVEFKRVREIDDKFDHAGADRNLGLLYLEAPAAFSIGDRQKAKSHLLKAIQLSPNYPDNYLNLIEAYLKWNDAKSAQAQLTRMEKIWPSAQQEFSGEDWKWSWVDWEKRRSKAAEKLRAFEPKR